MSPHLIDWLSLGFAIQIQIVLISVYVERIRGRVSHLESENEEIKQRLENGDEFHKTIQKLATKVDMLYELYMEHHKKKLG